MASRIGGLFGLGRHEYGGVVAAALTIPVAYGLHVVGGFPLVAAATLGLFALSVWADPNTKGPLVLARAAGQMLALAPLSGGLWMMDLPRYIFPYPGWIGGFVICLAFTIAAAGRFGRVADHAVAGGATAVVTLVSAAISHGWLN